MSDQPFFSEERFKSNLQIYQKRTVKGASIIQDLDASRLQPVQSKDGSWNLMYEKKDGEQQMLHSPYSPKKEAASWFQSIKNSTADVLYVYGVGLGYYYQEAKKWLAEKRGRFLVFLEDNPYVLRRFLETPYAKEILEDKRVQVLPFSSMDQAFQLISELCIFFIMARVEVTALENYRRKKESVYFAIRLRLGHESVRYAHLAREYFSFSAPFYRNFYRNMMVIGESFHGTQLFNEFQGVPAIICGAGPSLNKNAHLLKELENKALIIAGGSSLNALYHHGVEPHLGGTIDPNAAQRDRMWRNHFFNLPAFYRNRVHHLALTTLHGPRLYINGAGGYTIPSWFEKKLGIEDISVDEGHNVINFLTEVAYHMGCNPIIFVGMDLAYTDKKKYGDGILINQQENQKSLSEDEPVFNKQDIYGNPVLTEWKWVTESDWLGNYAKERPGTQFINATEGGIGMKDIPNHSLQEVMDTCLKKTRDLRGYVHQKWASHPLNACSFEKVDDLIYELHQSMKRTKSSLQILVDGLEGLKKKQKKRAHAIPIEKEKSLVEHEQKVIKEDAFTYVLQSMAEVKERVAQRNLLAAQADEELKTERQQALERIEINQEKFRFLHNAASFNVDIIEAILKEMKGRGFPVAERKEEEVTQ